MYIYIYMWIACGKYPAGVNQFTEVKVIHSGTMQYRRPDVRDDQQGAAAVNAFQRQVRGTYITNMKEKDRQYFGTAETAGDCWKAFSGDWTSNPSSSAPSGR